MLTAFVFDEQESQRREDWEAALRDLGDGQLLWLALRDPTEEDLAALKEPLDLGDASLSRLHEHSRGAGVTDEGERIHVAAQAAVEAGLTTIECIVGPNWIVTAHEGEIEVLDEFRERAEGGGAIGELDALSFVATLLVWVVASYVRAFERIEGELEELDASVMVGTPQDAKTNLRRLVELRRTIGTLRRALTQHREVVLSLAHPELDLHSSEESARRFVDLESRLGDALEAARDAKDSTMGSFDVLVTRIGQRTNEIMKVLTLVSVILLPSAVLAGIMGMNFQVGLFDRAWMFWAIVVAMVGIAAVALALARFRRWI
jgi:Mg2+ and Co2+ transporter CorA